MSAIDYIFKIIVVGKQYSGKTTLVNNYIRKELNENYSTTIGVEFCTKTVEVNNKKVKCQIWDTAGQERFRSIISTYYRGCSGALICFDINNRNEFLEIPFWIEEIKKNNIDKKVEIVIVATKIDKKKLNSVSIDEIKEIASKYKVSFCEASSKNLENIDVPFNIVINNILQKLDNGFNIKDFNIKSILDLERKMIDQQFRYDYYHPKRCCNIM